MRALGYPRVVSMESFRTPNFELVADCLEFLVTRYDETAVVEGDISAEADRVRFLKNVNEVFAQKARARLNLKRLYSADGVAVKELLKIADVLRKAVVAADEDDDDDERDETSADDNVGEDFDAFADFDARATRALASDITDAGAATHDALRLEKEELREARVFAAGGTADVREMERQVREQISSVAESVDSLERGLADLAKDEKTLRGVLEKRRAELERGEKRLGSLKAARPAHADELDALHASLPKLYAQYLEKHRNLAFLEASLAARRADEEAAAAKRDDALRAMRGRLREEEMRVLRGEENVGDDFEDEFDDELEEEDDRREKDGGFVKKKTASSYDALSRKNAGGGAAVPAARRFGIGGGVVGGTARTGPAPAKRAVVGSVMGGDASDSGGDDGSSSDENDF
jgi:clusterin-associated protein 1